MDIRQNKSEITNKATSFSNHMQPTKKHAISLQGKIFGVPHFQSVQKVALTSQTKFLELILYQNFLPHGVKAKDGIYKKQGT